MGVRGRAPCSLDVSGSGQARKKKEEKDQPFSHRNFCIVACLLDWCIRETELRTLNLYNNKHTCTFVYLRVYGENQCGLIAKETVYSIYMLLEDGHSISANLCDRAELTLLTLL